MSEERAEMGGTFGGYVFFTVEQLAGQPDGPAEGAGFKCPSCGNEHPIQYAKEEGKPDDRSLGFVVCSDGVRDLVVVGGKVVVGLVPAATGEAANVMAMARDVAHQLPGTPGKMVH